MCDRENNDMACDFDGGDCCEESCFADNDESCVVFDCKALEGLEKWGFVTSNDDLTFPFTTQKALMEVMIAQKGNGSFADLPSLSCADCDAYNRSESYLSIPFHVDTNNFQKRSMTTEGIDYDNFTIVNGTKVYRTKRTTFASIQRLYEMFPVLNETRERNFLGKNRIIGGVLLDQTRVKLGNCPISRQGLSRYFRCATDEESRDPFGVDPSLVSTSSLYRASNRINNFYEAVELNDQGVPFGFFYDGGCSNCGVHNFPILFDVNMNSTRVNTLLSTMIEGNYIDTSTSEVRL